MRMTIVKNDRLIIIDGEGYYADLGVFDDISWIENYDEKQWGKFHALQWYGDPNENGEYGFGETEPYGEIEFSKPVPNLIIKQLHGFEQAISIWENAKLAEQERIRLEEEMRIKLREEEEAKILESYKDFDLESLLSEL
jgi:hypothetical protein